MCSLSFTVTGAEETLGRTIITKGWGDVLKCRGETQDPHIAGLPPLDSGLFSAD